MDGGPQVRTDHPWYPGEMACSIFDRLFATQAESDHRVAGVEPRTDEQKALASWFWRNTHYYHARSREPPVNTPVPRQSLDGSIAGWLRSSMGGNDPIHRDCMNSFAGVEANRWDSVTG
jgi:hypothetical protein